VNVEALIFQQIVDANFDQAIYTASPNNTINVVQIAAKGSGTNIGLALTPKGTGYISAQVPDGTATGGNARGAGAVDFQTSRTGASQIASGATSCIVAGRQNDAIAEDSGIVCGRGNSARGIRSFVGTGFFCGAFAQDSAVLGGNGNTANGISSSCVGGERANASRFSQLVHASGRFAATGDAQWFLHELRNKTTNATETELFLDGASIRLVLAANFVIHANVMIVGSKSDGSAVARYDRQVTIKRVSNDTSLVGSVIAIGTDEAAGTSIAITADNTNESLKIAVTGIASETWRWVAAVHGIEMGIGT
jgi:hypothetical protein